MTEAKTIIAQDYFGNKSTFLTVWEGDCLGYTFLAGVDCKNKNELSLFFAPKGKKYYITLNTYFIDVFQKYNYSFSDSLRKDIKKFIVKDLLYKFKNA